MKKSIEAWDNLPIPITIFNVEFAFIYKNSAFDELISPFGVENETSFFSAISGLVGVESARDIYSSIKNPANGYCWKGTVHLKAKNINSVLAKLTIWPFTTSEPVPKAWMAQFDNITKEHMQLIQGLFSSLLKASELKDNDTGQHIERVNMYSRLLAQNMRASKAWPEIDMDFIETIGIVAAMHDVGKIGTPDDILNKQGPLNDFEWNIMKEHTINGAFILSSYPDPMAKQIAQSHHERWDGTGYPYNLSGTMIPLAARIVSVADVYDALRMKRSYKPAYTHEQSIKFILESSGLQFDPAIIDIFKAMNNEMATIYDNYADKHSESA